MAVQIGLAISRELASLLGGEIQLRSEVGKGSVYPLPSANLCGSVDGCKCFGNEIRSH